MSARIVIASLMAASLASAAHAAALRACTNDEISGAYVAPMPKDYASLWDFQTRDVRNAGYLVSIAGNGVPTVVCSTDQLTDPGIREAAAASVGRFVYWPDDVTAPGALAYVRLVSKPGGMSILSVLPRAEYPECDRSMMTEYMPVVEPIYRPTLTFPRRPGGGAATPAIIVEVRDTGAAYLFCRITGENIKGLEESLYYYAAGYRFPAKPGRTPFTYAIIVDFDDQAK